MIFFGLAGCYFTYYVSNLKEMRYVYSFIALSIVGIGSCMFHGTLRYHYQLWDELPMMIGNFIFLYTIIETDSKIGSKTNIKLIILFCIIAAICVIGYVFFKLWFLFISCYAGGVATQWYFLIPFLKNTKIYSIKMFILCVVCYYGGFILWLFDFNNCKAVQPYYFHSLWHIGAGYGTYLYLLILVMLRINIHKLHKNARIQFQPCPLPMHGIAIADSRKQV